MEQIFHAAREQYSLLKNILRRQELFESWLRLHRSQLCCENCGGFGLDFLRLTLKLMGKSHTFQIEDI